MLRTCQKPCSARVEPTLNPGLSVPKLFARAQETQLHFQHVVETEVPDLPPESKPSGICCILIGDPSLRHQTHFFGEMLSGLG